LNNKKSSQVKLTFYFFNLGLILVPFLKYTQIEKGQEMLQTAKTVFVYAAIKDDD
jgi:hypothetical protein